MSIRILHGADLHLDSPFEGLDDSLAARRRAEQRALLGRMAELAEREQVDLVLLAGDLLDSTAAYRETLDALEDAFRQITVPVLIAPGNHDFYGPRTAWAAMHLPENVHLFRENRLEPVHFPELGCTVWGAAFTENHSERLLRDFRLPEDAAGLQLLVLHGDAEQPTSPYNAMSPAELAASGFQYIALGHVHSASGLRRAGETHYAWPGCPEGRGFDETGEKGVYLVDVDEKDVQLRFVPLCGRRYEIVEVEASAAEDLSAAVRAAVPNTEGRDIVRVVLTGEVDAAPDLRALRAALTADFFALQLRDKTRLRRDLWEKAGEDTLRGQFLTRLRRMYDAAQTDREREVITLAAKYGLHALDGGDEI